MTGGLPRRAVLLGAAGALGGCGFHPIYAPAASGGVVGPELASIYVGVMGERQGQLLRQALQRRLQGTDDGVPKVYELTGGLNLSIEALGIQQDSSSNRTRINGSSNWVLRKLDLQSTVVTQGLARATDGININNQQYFAADLEQYAATKRLAETIAGQITLDLAAYFKQQKEKAA